MERVAKLTPVPLSGFLSLSAVSWHARVPRPYFMPQPFLGYPPSESSPHEDRVTPLGTTCSPAVIDQCARTYRSRPYQNRFRRLPRCWAQLPGIPRNLGVPFSRAEARFPVALDPQRRNHSLPPASPASKLYPPRESVRTEPELPRARVAVTLLGFFPSRDLVCEPRKPLPAKPLGLTLAGQRSRGPAAPCLR
jgi:hypothetical protein